MQKGFSKKESPKLLFFLSKPKAEPERETAELSPSEPTKNKDLGQRNTSDEDRANNHTTQDEVVDSFIEHATLGIQPFPGLGSVLPAPESLPGAYAVNSAPPFAPSLLTTPWNETTNNVATTGEETPQELPEDNIMTVATAVSNPEEGDSLQEARPSHTNASLSKSKRGEQRILGAVCLCLVVLVTAVIVTTMMNANSDQQLEVFPTNRSSADPTMAPTSLRFFQELALQTILPNSTWEVATQNPESPQALAYQWILEDPAILQSTHTMIDHHRILQRYALATFYYATNGDGWVVNDNWLNHSTHECTWHFNANNSPKQISTGFMSVIVNQTNPCNIEQHQQNLQEHVPYLHLWIFANNLKGEIPTELFLLSSLQSLNLRSNAGLTGTLCTEIGNLNELVALELGATGVSGHIPTELCQLSNNLKSVELTVTKLEGTLPTQLGLLKELETLSVTFSKSSGTLPKELANLTGLKALVLKSNNFTGTIPTQLGKLTQLENFELNSNALTGTIPTQLGLLANVRLFNHHENKLTGSIPSEIGRLTNCISAMVAFNALTGPIPSELGEMTKLLSLHLWMNHLSGTVPSSLGHLFNLSYLYMDANMLSGSLPTELGQLGELTDFWILVNVLSSSIPSEFGRLSSLFMLDLSSNDLSGSLPSELGQMAVIEHLNVARNRLTGQIPSQIGLMQTFNNFSTFIPAQMASLFTDYSDNSATYDYIVQNFLDLSNNNLSGFIPSEVQLLWNLGTLNLANNSQITGIVPEGLCVIEDLQFDCSTKLCGCNCNCNRTESLILAYTTKGK